MAVAQATLERLRNRPRLDDIATPEAIRASRRVSPIQRTSMHFAEFERRMMESDPNYRPREPTNVSIGSTQGETFGRDKKYRELFPFPVPTVDGKKVPDDGRYPAPLGIRPLREFISKRNFIETNVCNCPENTYISGLGASYAIRLFLEIAVGPNDVILVPQKAYPLYLDMIDIRKGIPLPYKFNGHEIDVDSVVRGIDLADQLDLKVKGCLISSQNPASIANPRSNLADLGEVLAAAGVPAVSDEVYHFLETLGRWIRAIDIKENKFDREKAIKLGMKSTHMAEVMKGGALIVFDSESKRRKWCSLREGFETVYDFENGGNERPIEKMDTPMGRFAYCTNVELRRTVGGSCLQYVALETVMDYTTIPEYVKALDANRDFFTSGIANIPGLKTNCGNSDHAAGLYGIIEFEKNAERILKRKFPASKDVPPIQRVTNAIAEEEAVIFAAGCGFVASPPEIIAMHLGKRVSEFYDLDPYFLRAMVAVDRPKLERALEGLERFMRRHL